MQWLVAGTAAGATVLACLWLLAALLVAGTIAVSMVWARSVEVSCVSPLLWLPDCAGAGVQQADAVCGSL